MAFLKSMAQFRGIVIGRNLMNHHQLQNRIFRIHRENYSRQLNLRVPYHHQVLRSSVQSLSTKASNHHHSNNRTSSGVDKEQLKQCKRNATYISASASKSTKDEGMKKNKASQNKGKSLSYRHRLKMMWSTYGTVAIGTYCSLGTVGVISLFFAVDNGYVDPSYLLDIGESAVEVVKKESAEIESKFAEANLPTDGPTNAVIAVLEKYEITKSLIPTVKDNPTLINLGVAWIVVKMAEPIRLAITFSIVPTIARILGYKPNSGDTKETSK